MNNDCVDALYGILKEKNLDPFCKRAILNVIGCKKDVNFIEITDITEGDQNENPRASSKIENQSAKDCRIKSIEFLNFRCFYNEETQQNKHFGIRFYNTCSGAPCSLFLVGGNGTGKSSIFSALERYYTGKSTHEEAANVGEERYLRYGFGDLNTAEIGYKVATGINDGTKEEHMEIRNDIVSSASFCTDMDMVRIEKSWNNLYDYVLEQFGYGELVQLRSRLEELGRNLPSEAEIGDDECTSSEWNEIIEAFLLIRDTNKFDVVEKFCNKEEILNSVKSKEPHSNEFADRWKIILSGYVSPDADIVFQGDTGASNFDLQVNKLADLYKELCVWLHDFSENNPERVVVTLNKMYDKKNIILEKERKNANITASVKSFKDSSGTLSKVIKEKCDSLIRAIVSDSQNFVEEVMSRFSPKNEVFRFCYDNDCLSVTIHVTTSSGSFNTSPHEYLNTFRFKLFCLTLKIAIAFSKMKERNVMAPIVIDDVLDASDFENTIKLEQFVYTVYKTYDELLRFDKPLQLILLTHDDMVRTAFKQGVSLRVLDSLNKPTYYNDNSNIYISGRLFDKFECAKYCADNPREQFVNLYL